MKKFLKRKSVDFGYADESKNSNGEGEESGDNTGFDGIKIIDKLKDLSIDVGLKQPEEESDEKFDPCDRLSFSVGVSENKNGKFRRTMEDVHTYVSNFCERLDWGYFAVFDGHAGKQTSKWVGSNLHGILHDFFIEDQEGDLRDKLNLSFVKADEEISKLKDIGSSGCTAAVAVLRWEEEEPEESEENVETDEASMVNQEAPKGSLLAIEEKAKSKYDFIPRAHHKRMLYTANVGDSRIVLSHRGKAKRLSYEHKGSDRREIKRIYKKGGLVLNGRVNGVLAVSRSLGDIYLKDYVIGNPYTTMTEITNEDDFLIIACDGLWDVCTDQEAIDLVNEKGCRDSDIASKLLCDYAIQRGSCDNVTVMVVILHADVFG